MHNNLEPNLRDKGIISVKYPEKLIFTKNFLTENNLHLRNAKKKSRKSEKFSQLC